MANKISSTNANVTRSPINARLEAANGGSCDLPVVRTADLVQGRVAKVYSYLRFSTPEQAMGDSERRQLELAKRFATERGLPFDDQMVLTDRGLSGFHGANQTKGVLGKFLARVDSGEITPGSILVVESIDRLSRREPIDAMKMIVFGLIEKGITVQTLSPFGTYDRQSINSPTLFALILTIQRAYEESKIKSERGQHAWMNKRRSAASQNEPMTARAVAWLQLVDGKFEIIEEAAIAVRKIFDLKLNGFGYTRIVKALNSGGVWLPPRAKGWRASYIKKILANPAVIGEYQPHRKVEGQRVAVGEPIPHYYPPVVTADQYFAVRAQLVANRGRGGRTGKANNLFVHIAKCGYCGGSMTFVDKGKPPKGGAYLRCDNKSRGLDCSGSTIRYEEVEGLILTSCRSVQLKDLLSSQNTDTDELEVLTTRRQSLAGRIRQLDQQIAILTERIATTPDKRVGAILDTKLSQVLAEQDLLRDELREVTRNIQEKLATSTNVEAWQMSLLSLLESGMLTSPDVRLKLRERLRQVIRRIEIYTVGYPLVETPFSSEVHDTGQDRKRSTGYRTRPLIPLADEFEDYLRECLNQGGVRCDSDMSAFSDFVVKQLSSKEARFICVVYHSGKKQIIAPDGSIATTIVRSKNGSELTYALASPSLKNLYYLYSSGKACSQAVSFE